MQRNAFVPILVGLVAALTPASASAATIGVGAGGDDALSDPDNGTCTLREAIAEANANLDSLTADCDFDETAPFGDDTINLAATTVVLDVLGSGEDAGNTGDLDVDTNNGDLTIDGASTSTSVIDTNDAPAFDDRVIQHLSDSGELALTDLTVAHGNRAGSPSIFGGGIASTGLVTEPDLALERVRVTANNATDFGGGVAAGGGSLSIRDSLIDLNQTAGSSGGGISTNATTEIDSTVIRDNDVTFISGGGGGISANFGELTITESMIGGNGVSGTSNSGGGLNLNSNATEIRNSAIIDNELPSTGTGGGIRIFGAGATLALVNATVSGNQSGEGGGIRADGGTTTIVHSTFGPNPTTNAPSAIAVTAGTVNARGLVVETAGLANACLGAIASGGRNVFTDSSCQPAVASDESDADPMLGPLADNGGPDAGPPGFTEPIPTHAPDPSSTVIDHVPAAECDDTTPPGGALLTDQRLLPRPDDGDDDSVADCEAGSVELQAGGGPIVNPPDTATAAQSTPAPIPSPTVSRKKCPKGKKLVKRKGKRKCVKKKKR